jgi:hypothetical protein
LGRRDGRASTLLTLHDADHALIDTQLFIAVTLLAALTLAVEVAERTRAEECCDRPRPSGSSPN